MENISKEAKNIYLIIREFGPVRSVDIAKKAKISTKNMYKHLGILKNEGLILKTGTTPAVYYKINDEVISGRSISDASDQYIENNYIYVSPNGDIVRGINGFSTWCIKHGLDFEKEKVQFIRDAKSINKLKKNQLISAKRIILSGKKELFLDNIYFSDFYTFAHFGKTKLGQLVYVGKSSQNQEMIQEIVFLIKPVLEKLIADKDIKYICFIPPTIQRKIQFIDVFRKKLNLKLLEIEISKIKSSTLIAQKSLRKLEDRILNAQKSLALNPNLEINGNILIIDDATGSGATLNETARKLRKIVPEKIKIYGYSIVGSYKGFDVISEV